MQLKRKIGLQFAHERKKLGLNQEDVAKEIGVNKQTITNLESGRHGNIDTIEKICAVLDCTLEIVKNK